MYLKKVVSATLYMMFSLCLASCSTAYIDPEVVLPEQKVGKAPDKRGMAKLVVFNGSNFLIHSTNKVKATLNGKVIGQLNLKEYVVVDVAKGRHQLVLEHTDILPIRSDHVIDVSKDEEYLKIVGTLTSNKAYIVKKPSNFVEKFDQAYEGTAK